MPRVALTFPRGDGVIGTQALRGVAEFLKIIGQDPRANQDIHTRIKQVFFLHAVPLEHGQPARVDLHEADITRAVGIDVDRVRATTRLVARNCF